jgi:hypothetical protein
LCLESVRDFLLAMCLESIFCSIKTNEFELYREIKYEVVISRKTENFYHFVRPTTMKYYF